MNRLKQHSRIPVKIPVVKNKGREVGPTKIRLTFFLQHPRARNDYDEETAYEIYMNPEPGFQSGPGDSANAD